MPHSAAKADRRGVLAAWVPKPIEQPTRVTVLAVALVMLCVSSAVAQAVEAVFDPDGASFWDLPFPHEQRRDPDGTIAVGDFPLPVDNPFLALLEQYRDVVDEADGFGLSSGVSFKFSAALDESTFPADPAATRLPTASVFLLNIDSHSPNRGLRTPLWIDFRTEGDAYSDDNLLVIMPVPGHPLEKGTLHAAVVTDAVRDLAGIPVASPSAMQRLKAETPATPKEAAMLPLYQALWEQLETKEGIRRERVVTATVFRTADPTRPMRAVERLIRRRYRRPGIENLRLDSGIGEPYLTFRGEILVPQFQTGTPPFAERGTGRFVFDDRGQPVVQREERIRVVVRVPRETTDASVRARRWPVVTYLHGTCGDANSAPSFAAEGIATVGFDGPLHGVRAGTCTQFYHPLFPVGMRDNFRQYAAEALVVHYALRRLRIDPSLVPPEFNVPPFVPLTRKIRFDPHRRLYMGTSLGATVGPIFASMARHLQGGVVNVGGGHVALTGIMTAYLISVQNRFVEVIKTFLGLEEIDVFHPILHALQTGFEAADPVAYANLLATDRRRRDRRRERPLSLLFVHGLQDDLITTPMVASLVAAARYPLIAPTFPNIDFPMLPGYSYQEAFDLAGLPTLEAPVSGNMGAWPRVGVGTGGLVQFPDDGHYVLWNNEEANYMHRDFLRSLAYDPVATIPARPACGDGIISGSEVCDDTASPTGCPPNETCVNCSSCQAPICGDCIDAGRTIYVGGPGTKACHVFDRDQANCELAWHCGGSGNPATCWYDTIGGSCNGCGPRNDGVNCTNTCIPPPVCGNGVVEAGEQCDDGNVTNGDGCDENCQIETVDGCDSPTRIPAAGGTFNGTTSGFGVQAGTCPSGGTGLAPDAVFEWTPSASGTASIDTFGSDYDTVLYIRAADCAAGTELACNDDAAGSRQSAISPTVSAGTTYFIFVDGYGGASGNFTLTVTLPAGSPSGAFVGFDGPLM